MKEYTQEVLQQFRERLKRILKKKYQTTMIHSLSQFELEFGHLWGHGKPEESLTEEETAYRQKWNDCRTNILDNGHRQIRNTFTELNMHDVIWNRYTVKMPVRQKERLHNGN